MNSHHQLAALTVATFVNGFAAFDKGFKYQLREKDDTTLAAWTAVGIEASTLAVVLANSPANAFVNDRLPDDSAMRSFSFRTKPYAALRAEAAASPSATDYPRNASSFMDDIRNKLFHLGSVMHVGLVEPSLKASREMAEWLAATEQLPTGPMPIELDIIAGGSIEDLATSLRQATVDVARDHVEFLETTLGDGMWDDEPQHKEVALRELEGCRELI